MSNVDRPSYPVVVVGAGPAGLTLAITLARQGIECLLVERRPTSGSLPRATAVSLRTMELLRSWGLEDAVRAGGNDVELVMLECETLADAARGTTHAVGYPTTEQAAVISPTAPGCVPQDHLEAVLREHLVSLPSARLEVGVEVTAIDTGAGTQVKLRDLRTGAERSVDARYVIAADGAHSTVRTALGIPMPGPDRLYEGMMIQFHAPLWDVVGAQRFILYAITHAEAHGTLLPAGLNDRWSYGIEWDPEREHLADYSEQRLARLIALAAGVPNLEPRITAVGAFTFAAQLAERFRERDVFLVGDAAHRITPRGGTGMNTAIADGFDLAWRLSWVLRGWAPASLLDGYECERRPVIEHNLMRSIDPNGSRRDPLTELDNDLGGRVRHHWMARGNGQVSTLDLVGNGLTMFAGPPGDAWAEAVANLNGRLPIAVHPVDHLTARAIGITAGGALLARPDGAPVASWPATVDTVRSLHEAIASMTAPDDGHRSVPDPRSAVLAYG